MNRSHGVTRYRSSPGGTVAMGYDSLNWVEIR